MSDEYLLWVDVETTGLDYNKDSLLEVAAVITNLDASIEYGEFHRTLYYTEQQATLLREGAVEFVRDMHDKTGLWNRLPVGEKWFYVDADFKEFICATAPGERQMRLAGNSVRLDLNFIEANLFTTYGYLHYRSVDVSALAYVMDKCWGLVDGYYQKEKTHAALADIRESIAEYRWLHSRVEQLLEIEREYNLLKEVT